MPVITRLLDEEIASEGDDKQIICGAEGWPKPTIKWKRNNVDLKDDINYGIRVHPTLSQVALIIRSASQDHVGEYHCEASNAFGTTRRSVWFEVLGKLRRISLVFMMSLNSKTGTKFNINVLF